MRLVGKQKWDAAMNCIRSATTLVDVRVHQPKDGNKLGRCEICNERWPCFQNALKETLREWEKISA